MEGGEPCQTDLAGFLAGLYEEVHRGAYEELQDLD